MNTKRKLRKAFTLTELLLVVIVLGVLASVAVPKFSRVLETRKTTEAESILSALRTEQEHRCVLGKEYQIIPERVESLASAKDSRNYTYSLTRTGAKATSSKGYSIAMPTYQNGQLCCEGSYCSSLNKSYPSCSSLSMPDDECAVSCEDCTCEEYAQSNRCECDASYKSSNPCVCSPNSCACSSYADENPCECSPDTCACSTYAEKNPCKCSSDPCDCPSTSNTCACSTYASANSCTCNNDCTCEEKPEQAKCQTCSNPTYAAAHPCACGGKCNCSRQSGSGYNSWFSEYNYVNTSGCTWSSSQTCYYSCGGVDSLGMVVQDRGNMYKYMIKVDGREVYYARYTEEGYLYETVIYNQETGLYEQTRYDVNDDGGSYTTTLYKENGGWASLSGNQGVKETGTVSRDEDGNWVLSNELKVPSSSNCSVLTRKYQSYCK